MPHQRFPKKLFMSGKDPDARFSLANERTFLAWIRTALALLAGGVALEVLGLALHPGLRVTASLLLIGAGILASVQAWYGWFGTEQALRHQRPLPSSGAGAVITGLVCLSGLCILLSLIFG